MQIRNRKNFLNRINGTYQKLIGNLIFSGKNLEIFPLEWGENEISPYSTPILCYNGDPTSIVRKMKQNYEKKDRKEETYSYYL